MARGSASDGLSEFGAVRVGPRGLALCGPDGGTGPDGCGPRGGAVRAGSRPGYAGLGRSRSVLVQYAHRVRSTCIPTPPRLIARTRRRNSSEAKAASLDVVALTDHDTAAGWAEAAAALPVGLTLVPGTEFSCAWFGPNGARVGLHLLGYLYDPDDEELQAERRRLRESRRGRGQAIVNNLRADGIPVTWERVAELAGDGTVGRPHIGQALVEAGVVGSLDEAFADLLSSRSKYYVRKADMDVFVALRLINAAGGVTAFAHPLARRRGTVVGDEVIADMAAAGLDGIEVDHPDHSFADRAHLSMSRPTSA